MSTEVAKIVPKTGVMQLTREQLYSRMSKVRDTMGSGYKAYLSYDGRKGKFSYKDGEENVEVPLGTLMLVNLLDATQGYTCWEGGANVGESDPYSIFDDTIPPISSMDRFEEFANRTPEPNKQKEGWVHYFCLPMRDLETGKEFLFKVNSVSGVRSIGNLLDDIKEAEGVYDILKDTPVVKLGSSEFKSKGYTNEKPTFEIVEWKRDTVSAPVADGGASANAAMKELKDDVKSTPKSRKK